MFKSIGALHAPEEGDVSSGAAGGEEEKGKQPKDVVPTTQLIAALKNQGEQHARDMQALKADFEAKLATATEKPAIEAPKAYTRAELNALVEARSITQDQADTQMDMQIRSAAEAAAARVATETVAQAKLRERVDDEIARYTVVAPEILDEAHGTRDQIRAEYQYLLGLGDKPSVKTQLKAIRSVLGPVDKLERSRNGTPAHESHREDGGSGGDGGGRKPKGGSGELTYDGLTQREKSHYDRLLASGLYKDKAAVNAELKFSNSRTRAKYNARA